MYGVCINFEIRATVSLFMISEVLDRADSAACFKGPLVMMSAGLDSGFEEEESCSWVETCILNTISGQ